MFVEVSLHGKPQNGIWVPRSALRDGRVLLADADDRLRSRDVTTVMTQDGIAMISGDISAGARILVSQPGSVVDGMLLSVTEDAALMAWLAEEGHAN